MNAQQLRNSILQQAIQGKLVPQDPTDEPASVLLQRIRKEKEQLVKEGKLKKKDLESKPIEEDEIPFEIPMGWEWCRLGEVFQTVSGTTPQSKNPEYYKDGTINWVRTTDLNNGVLEKTEIKITEKAFMDCNLKILPENSVCVALYGGAGTIGKNAILRFCTTINQSVCALLPNDNCEMVYLLYYLQWQRPRWMDYASGSRKDPNINQIIVKNCLFPLPPLAEQRRIVAKIEELMPLVERYGKAQQALDQLNESLPAHLRQSILQEAIQGRLVPQDPKEEPASELLKRIRKEKEQLVKEGKLKKKDLESKPIEEDEIPFEIPESWEWVRLGEISTYSHTKKKINASKADSHIWGLDLEDIEKGGKLLCVKTVEERKAIGDKTYFNRGDILYSKLRPYLLKILVAPKDGICTPEIIPFTCFGNISSDYIVDVLKSAYVDDYINSVTFGVKMPRVSTETMTSLLIPLPPLSEQKRIVAKVEELFMLIKS